MNSVSLDRTLVEDPDLRENGDEPVRCTIEQDDYRTEEGERRVERAVLIDQVDLIDCRTG